MDWTLWLNDDVLRLAAVVATPTLLAALGELVIERSGVLNVAIEGMMALGASLGFLGAYLSGYHIVGILSGMTGAIVLGAILGWTCISLRAHQLTVGLALFVAAVGLASLAYRLVVGLQFVPPKIGTFGPGLLGLPAPTWVLVALAACLHAFFYYTPLGLRLRACGENPRAAESQGVSVIAVRYASVLAGSALIGLGGALLPMLLTGTYTDMMVGGRGWIALMLVILGRWTPLGIMAGGLLFGYVEALQYNLLLRVRTIPSQFLLMVPYLFVIVVAIRAYRGAQAPQALMRPYDRELRT